MRLTEEQAKALGITVTPPPASSGASGQTGRAPRSATGKGSPEWILKTVLTERWPELAIPEYTGAVPGRHFRLDVGFPHVRLAVECDGWAWHGKHKGDFHRDRERDRALLLAGWRVLRFFASEIRRSPGTVVETVEQAVGQIEQCKTEQPNSQIAKSQHER